MTNYKTTTGLERAADRLIARLDSEGITPENEKELDAQSSNIIRQCQALWSSPADVHHFAKLANRVRDAWHKAVYGEEIA